MTYGKVDLTQNPTVEDLANLFAQCDDSAGHHILWVDNSGSVFIDLLPEDKTPAWWAINFDGKYKFRWETFVRGNGYVGIGAGNDEEYVEKQLKKLIEHWTQGKSDYIDY